MRMPPHAASQPAAAGASSSSGGSTADQKGGAEKKRAPPAASDQQKKDIGSFFRQVDSDADGQIETHELSEYLGSSVGGNDFDTEREIRDAVVGGCTKLNAVDPKLASFFAAEIFSSSSASPS
jgi:hypothetical protein